MNGYDAYCLIIEEDNNNIFGNIFTDNFYGIRIQNTVANNLIYNNDFTMNTFGLVVCNAGYNEITNNIFTDNDIGINLESGSFENIIHHNYFKNNAFKSFDYTNCKNQWNNIYPSGGNYWDDYTGVDNYKGLNQNEPGSDGIGDTPYTIQGLYNCQDRYPLVESSPSPNNPPNIPSNLNPVNHAISVDINADLSWSGGDPDSGDTVTYDIYFGTTSDPPLKISDHISTIYDPGVMNYNTKYFWKIVSKDNPGASTTSPIWDFTTIYVNYPPNIPYNPTPQNGKTSININQVLYWTGGDPNINDTVTYDIYFGTSSPPTKTVSNQSATSYNPGTMSYNTPYYWKIIAWDNHGKYSTSPIWSYTTGKQSTAGGGSSGGGEILLPNKIPIANASASDKNGLVNTTIKFNASYSIDEDGEITNYTWDFNDGSYGYGIFTTHIYKKDDVYNVKLTVTDDNDITNTVSYNIIISQPSSPPSIPQIDGPKTGKQNIEYSFIVISIDTDNDNIQYVFDWGDGQKDETEFYTNGIAYIQKHIWTSPGFFKIKVYAIDSKIKTSAATETYILIDVIYCKNLGYFIDENSDGIYDLFYSNQTGVKTTIEKQPDGSYLINNDINSDWDYIYNIQTGALVSYYSETPPPTQIDNTIYYLLIIGIIIVIIFLVAISRLKKGKKVETIKEKKKTVKTQYKPIEEQTEQIKQRSEESISTDSELDRIRDKIDKL